ncbi:MAG: SDR family oxidoreductase [Chlorobiaceae bacterium]|jgi:NAD(P)-dependent dehydrogenase (short-subunit alcohol dehydrogenase family)
MTSSGKKVCFITGACGAVGIEIALSIAGQGYTIFFTWHSSEEKAKQTLEKIRWISPESQMVRCDVSKSGDISNAFSVFRQQFDRLDLLVTSASNFFSTPLPDVTEQEWDSLVNTNLKGTFFSMQEAVKIMQKQPFVSRIISMTDISADLVWRNFAPYTVSKAGIQHLTRVFAKTFAPTILVNSIAPGTVTVNPERDMETQQEMIKKIPLKRLGDPLDIIRTVIFLLESDYITGQIFNVDGGRLLQ